MKYKNTIEADRYQQLLKRADDAEKMYHHTGSDDDWEYFMHCEHIVSSYAQEFEEEIFNG